MRRQQNPSRGIHPCFWTQRKVKKPGRAANTPGCCSQQPCGAGRDVLRGSSIATSPTPASSLGEAVGEACQTPSPCPARCHGAFGMPGCNTHVLLRDLCRHQAPLQPRQPRRRGAPYQIFHPQRPVRAKEHADALHKPTIRDPLMEMDYNLQMIKTQLTAVGRYSRLCKGALQMRSYQDLRCPKHLSILG